MTPPPSKFANFLNTAGEKLKQQPYYDSLFKEVVGTNIPKMGLAAWFGTKVGNFNEFTEQSIMQLGNTAYVFAGGKAYDWLLDKVFAKAFPKLDFKGITQLADKQTSDMPRDLRMWHKMGKSAALYGMLMPFMLTIPNLRNWYTINQTGTTNFVEMSFQDKESRQDFRNRPKEEKAEARALAKENMDRFLAWNATGLGLGLVGMAASMLAIHKNASIPEWVYKADNKLASLIDMDFLRNSINKITTKAWGVDVRKDPEDVKNNSIFLKNGTFNQLTGAAVTLSWVYTGYGGYFVGGRDKVENKENILNTIVAILSFSFAGSLIKKGLLQTLPKQKWGIDQDHLATLASMGIGTALYGLLPMGISMMLRKKRAVKEGLLEDDTTSVSLAPRAALESHQPVLRTALLKPALQRSQAQALQWNLASGGRV